MTWDLMPWPGIGVEQETPPRLRSRSHSSPRPGAHTAPHSPQSDWERGSLPPFVKCFRRLQKVRWTKGCQQNPLSSFVPLSPEKMGSHPAGPLMMPHQRWPAVAGRSFVVCHNDSQTPAERRVRGPRLGITIFTYLTLSSSDH